MTRRHNPEPTVEAQRDRNGDIAGVTVRLAGGSVSAIRSRFDKPDVMHVGWSELPESARGKGLGVQMYAALMDWALENGITLTSDEALSPAAGRVWEALAKRGYPIEKHPTARLYTEDDRSAWGADDRNKPFTLKRRNPRRRNPHLPKVLAFLEDFASATVPSPVGWKHSRMFPGVPVSLQLGNEPDYATIDYFAAHPESRGTGAGTEAMRRILDLADKHGVTIFLDPVPLDEGGSVARLVRWYASFGFVFAEPDEGSMMVRAPGAKGARRPNPRPTSAERTDPALWEAVKREVTAGSKGGVRGEWSARKAQLAVALYKKRGGGYLGPKSPQNALAKWTREDWRTRSGDPSLVTGERYLPARAIAALTPAEYAATTRVKRAGMRKGEQFTAQPERIAAKTARYRKNPTRPEADAIRAIRANLTPDLLTGAYRACATRSPVAGHCAVATEALYFTLGGKSAGYTPMNVRHEGVSHWYLRTPDGRYLDPTADQFDTPVDYARGRGRGFPTPRQGRAEPPPSKRAATLLRRLGGGK
jgi:GNAT superfamily N-acetyltransferase